MPTPDPIAILQTQIDRCWSLTECGVARSIELMHKISPEHGSWMRTYYMAILAEFPLEEYEIRNARWPLK